MAKKQTNSSKVIEHVVRKLLLATVELVGQL